MQRTPDPAGDGANRRGLTRRTVFGLGAVAAAGIGLPAAAHASRQAPLAPEQTGPQQAGSERTSAPHVRKLPGNTLTRIRPNPTAAASKNPLSGWVLYGTSNPESDFWPHLDELAGAPIQDYASTLYLRLAWSVLEPEEGVPGWDTNAQLKSMLDTARQRGMRLAFRVVVDSRDKHENFTPRYVRDAGAQGYETQTGSATVWSPYPDDPVFQQKYEAFLTSFAAEFDDPDVTAFVDGFGLGKWGEGHSMLYLDEANRQPVFDWNIDLFLRSFRSVPVAVNYHRMIGYGDDWGEPAPGSAELLESAYEKGCMLRHDAFGMTTYYGQWERDLAERWRFRRPILMEGGWIVSSHDYTVDPRGYQTDRDVRQGEFDDSAEGHVNTMDFRVGDETDSWFTQARDLVDRFAAEGGYLLYPSTVSLPPRAAPGSTVNIGHTWKNDGWGYCPNNLPQWNHRYKVGFALLDADGTARQLFVDEAAEPADWIQGSPSTYGFSGTVDVPAGEYRWGVALVDSTKQHTPGLRLAAQGELRSGWLLVGACTIE